MRNSTPTGRFAVYDCNMGYHKLQSVTEIRRIRGTDIYEGRTESHEQLFFLHANWEQQAKESVVVDGTSCCVILEYPVTSIACIT